MDRRTPAAVAVAVAATTEDLLPLRPRRLRARTEPTFSPKARTPTTMDTNKHGATWDILSSADTRVIGTGNIVTVTATTRGMIIMETTIASAI